ncbi:MAG: helix-turn-helix domain-containing protein [Lachnospiraceae bacterium]|nr:helix-turn-helix domain-containing protein [Ruminococcus sp.]MCM1274995.1 helix-turn-helix domain-containing protein [Lachnospiraceae bacterium]
MTFPPRRIIIFKKGGGFTDTKKTGAFIARLRRERGLTQKELADKIGVTDKAVSKWERGRGFPDVSLLESLSEELGVSAAELINGERSSPETLAEQSDSALIGALLYVRQMSRRALGTLLVIFGACMLLSPLVVAGNSSPIFAAGIIVTIGGVFMLTSKKSFKIFALPQPALEGVSLAALIAALILELLPNGVILRWATPPGEPPQITRHAYFDPLPYGMGTFPPFITALLTAAVTLFTVIVMIFGKRAPKLRSALFVCITVTAAVSACIILYGLKYVTAAGVFITLTLVVSALFRAAANAKSRP